MLPRRKELETRMDMITASLLEEFSKEHDLEGLPEEQQFEHLAAYVAIRRQVDETFDPTDIVTGSGGDTGLDAIAILVNGALVTDVEQLEELAQSSGYLDALFVFVQAKRSASFETSVMATLAFGVDDFFRSDPRLPRNEKVTAAAEIMRAIYKRSPMFKRGNPACRLHYVTTGKWTGDAQLEARRAAAISDLTQTNLFRSVEFDPIDASTLHTLYREAKNAISRQFTFPNPAVVPEIAGVSDAYLGLLPAPEFLSIICDDDGEIVKSIFYDNVRDFQSYDAAVNADIRTTLASDYKSRFALMNNGVTIIARNLQRTGNKIQIEDFQIVNGCQTSHVLVNQRENIDASVMIPLRLIATQDEDVINSIIRATNRQTQVKDEQFFALTEFPKKLETYFQTFPNGRKLYYERRSRQYDSLPIEKVRIITQATLIRSFAAMFLEEPHSTTRSYKALLEKVGSDIFGPDHTLSPYYVAALAYYLLDFRFRTYRTPSVYKAARYHILLAVRLLGAPGQPPKITANAMDLYCNTLLNILWDSAQADELFIRATGAVDAVAGGNFHRDNIRTQPFTQSLIDYCEEATHA
jgi:hypothetical protein